ncbi:MAG: hypothetical protein AAGH64_12570 [Planctomycetota bacterium]
MKNALPILAGAVVGCGIAVTDAQAQFTSEEIVREIVPAIEGVPGGIEGALIYEEKRNRTDFTIVAEGLPIGAYAVFIDGDFKGFLSSFRSRGFETFAELEFSTRQRGDRLLLNFDPRDALVEIRSLIDNDRLYASGSLPLAVDVSENEPVEFNSVRIREEFASLDDPTAEGRIDIRSNRRQTRMNVRVKGLAPGVYELRANGMPISDIIAVGRGQGKVNFSTRPRGSTRMLGFDPTGVTYELTRINLLAPQAQDAELPALVANVGTAQDPGGDLLPVGMMDDALAYAGFDDDADASIMFTNTPDFASLDIDLTGVPVGQYQVLVEVAPGAYEQLATFQAVSLDESPEGEEESDTDEAPAPPLAQGLGGDNNGENTRGRIEITTTGFTIEGSATDAAGFPTALLSFDDQGLPLLIVDGEDRVWFKGTFPDSGFAITSLVP